MKLPNNLKHPYLLYLLLIIILIIPIVLVALLGTYSRFHADDFCAVGTVNRLGFWRAAQFWYLTWTGRFSFIFFTQFMGLGGPQLARFLPGIFIAAWLVGFGWLFSVILSLLHRIIDPAKPDMSIRSSILPAMALSALTLYFLLDQVPNLFQSVLWQSGSINFSLPLILLTFNTAFILHAIVRAENKPLKQYLSPALVVFFISLVAGGFHEIYIVFQLTLMVFSLIVSILWTGGIIRRILLFLLISGILGALIGFGIVFLAPGNIARQQTLNITAYPDPIHVLLTSLYDAYITGHSLIKHHGLTLAAILLTSIGIGSIQLGYSTPSQANLKLKARWMRNLLPILVSLIPICFGFVTVTMLPSEYFLKSYPDPRAMIVPLFAIAVTVVWFGLLVGFSLKFVHLPLANPWLLIPLIALLFYTSAASTRKFIVLLPESQAYASLWDQRDEKLKQAIEQGETQIAAPGLAIWNGIHDLAFEPDNWINRCLAWYYGFDQVEGR